MNEVSEEVDRLAVRGARIAIAMVVGAARSAPRPLRTKMAINDRREIAGGASGGCVEEAVVEIADADAWGVGYITGTTVAADGGCRAI